MGQLEGFGLQLGRGHHLVDQSHFPGLRRVEPLGQQGQFQRLSQAQQAGQEVGRGGVGADADVGVGQHEVGIVGGDGQVAGGDQGNPRPGGRALNAAQHGLVHPAQPVDGEMKRVQAFQQLAAAFSIAYLLHLLEALDVAPGHEMPPRAAQHHAAHGIVEFHLGGEIGQAVAHFHAQRVAGFRPVERDEGDGILDVQGDVIGHGCALLGTVGGLG